jgi:hypothetical protein
LAALRELATHKLPDVEALIERAQAMRAWLLTATDCSCISLDVCALFDRDGAPENGSGGAERLHVTRVGSWPPAPSRSLVAFSSGLRLCA